MRLAFSTVALVLAASGAFAAPGWRDYPGVSNTSFVEPSGARAIQLSVIVPAEPKAVFDAFTTSEGFSSWAVPVARVDLRIGGEIEASYDGKAAFGDPNNIRNRIDAYVPGRLLVIHNLQAPKGLPGAEAFARTVTIIELAPAGPNATRVTLTNAGYGPGRDFDAAYAHFEWGDAYTLAQLKRRFEKGPTDWSKPATQAAAGAASDAMMDRR
jgi:uncharacterized protein YndB with AHSA1/START domain